MAEQLIDMAQLDEIRAVLGEERTAGLVALYLAELASDRADLRAALGRCDLAGAAAAAHSIAGASLNIGGRAVASAARMLQMVLDPRAHQGATALHHALRQLDAAAAETASALAPACQCEPLAAA
ncbi:Hpt domain-containing protein [Sphingomonas sp. BN140010]|uniref:Hpt domain-containing protein n=1 Tax=Sphingomonas arvum TaxID=2992113 RepID=A0ABT3JF23_9SPHN|nr:Hpt domain-containing protein [Sphingomonas sp. BN140010]MCW3797677.1 Hpt domain-containing protein [Sphingomonas sp. BN140010]